MPVRLAGARCSDDDRSVVAPYHQLGEAFEIVADLMVLVSLTCLAVSYGPLAGGDLR